MADRPHHAQKTCPPAKVSIMIAPWSAAAADSDAAPISRIFKSEAKLEECAIPHKGSCTGFVYKRRTIVYEWRAPLQMHPTPTIRSISGPESGVQCGR